MNGLHGHSRDGAKPQKGNASTRRYRLPSEGMPTVKFTLVYDGRLHSQGAEDVFTKKWKIREYINPQLAELWRVHPALRNLMKSVPKSSYWTGEVHHSLADAVKLKPATDVENIELQDPIEVGGIKFVPLVRESYALACSLKILFMRKEAAGKVYMGGDLDNRIKVFIDALKVPRKSEAGLVAKVSPVPREPVNCLLEDDGLITGLAIESTRLLDAPSQPENYVRLVAEVSVSVTFQRMYNTLFLGD